MSKFLLTNIVNNSFGLNSKFKINFLKNIGLNIRKTPSVLNKIEHIKSFTFLKNTFIVDKKLTFKIKDDISFLKINKNFRGIRHSLSLPTRGQRTHTNAKTKKKIKN